MAARACRNSERSVDPVDARGVGPGLRALLRPAAGVPTLGRLAVVGCSHRFDDRGLTLAWKPGPDHGSDAGGLRAGRLCGCKLRTHSVRAPIAPVGQPQRLDGWVVNVASPRRSGQRLLIAPTRIGAWPADATLTRLRVTLQPNMTIPARRGGEPGRLAQSVAAGQSRVLRLRP